MSEPRLSRSSYDTVVFDCGDTLVRLEPSREAIFRDAAEEIGITLTLAEVARAYELVDFALKMKSSELRSSTDLDAFYLAFNGSLCGALGISLSLERLHLLLRDRFKERRRWAPFPEVAGALAQLSKRVPLFVLANWDTGLERVLEDAGVLHFFRGVHASAELGAEKPAKACYDALIAKAGLRPESTLYVGNEYVADVVGSRAAGLTPVLVDRLERHPRADCVRVRDLHELTTLLTGKLP